MTNAEKCRAYRERHPDRVVTQNAVYRKRHAEKRNKYSRDWRAENPERVRELNAAHYQANRVEVIARVKRSYRERRALVIELKSKPCTDCGKQYPPYVMTFDHRNPEEKAFEISRASHLTIERFLEEIAKCDLVCANCHAERTWGQGRKRS